MDYPEATSRFGRPRVAMSDQIRLDKGKPISAPQDIEQRFEARFTQLRKEFEQHVTAKATQELLLNRGYLDEQLGRLLSSLDPTDTPPSYPRRSQTTLEDANIVGVKLNLKASPMPMFRQAFRLPAVKPVPPYTSWIPISVNQQHSKVRNRKRLFYTCDDTGETLPATEDDSEYREGNDAEWKSVGIEFREFCLEKLKPEFGDMPCFATLLATYLGVELQSTEDRIAEDRVRDVDTTKLLCRRCIQYNCSLHPESSILPAWRTPPQVETTDHPCGKGCHMNSDREHASTEWTPDDVKLLEQVTLARSGHTNQCSLTQGVDIYGENPCRLKIFVFTKSCSEIYSYLRDHPGVADRRCPQAPKRRKTQRGKNSVSRKGAPVVARRLRHRETELWHQYLPCGCTTTCGAACPCVKSKNFCDKYCACWSGPKAGRNACGNGWKGCRCGQKCDTQRCPCVAAARECDPDVCSCYGRLDGCNHCKNMCIRSRKHKRVAMGLSRIIGWGTFMLEDVKKDDLIGEYTGELIADEEAERRGRIYDIEDKSYLFSATKETVIDANQRGNKLRFANHSSEPNCYVKYLLVDGDYRVGIFAGQDIQTGEELLYDYGSSFLSNWNDDLDRE